MSKIIKVFVGLIAVCIIGIIGVTAFSAIEDNPLQQVAEEAKVAATNAAIDASGVKNKVQTALENNVGRIAEKTGMSEAQVSAAVDALAVESWQATTLPEEVESTGSFSGSYGGMSGTITTYEDPSYVTVEAYGQEVTLEVPAEAQQYLPYLSYLK